MSKYIPNTGQQQREMLEELSLHSVDELFADIPEDIRFKGDLKLPDAMSEIELVKHMEELAGKNKNLDENTCFLGAGAYDHYIPGIISHITSRQEFYTAYTPYQPEISQGTLQAIYEYQTMICELTGMHISNVSMYDGATALAEAASIACLATGRREVIVAGTVHPESRAVLNTYSRFKGNGIIEVGYSDGKIDKDELGKKISGSTAAVIVQNPNFFGIIENLTGFAEMIHSRRALFIVSVDPISLGILKPPGEYGADIVVGEGQSMGNHLSFGGPYLGFFAATGELMRKMPGRIVGQTTDRNNRRGFVLTIQTREQHIRREKATSNICSNQALNALAAAVYMSVMGKQGMKEVAELCLQKAHYAYSKLIESGKFKPVFSAPFFKEFIVKSLTPVEELNGKLLKDRIIGGYQIDRDYPELADGWLIAVTEKRTRAEMDRLVEKAAAI